MRRGSTYFETSGASRQKLRITLNFIPYRDLAGYTNNIDNFYPPQSGYRTLSQIQADHPGAVTNIVRGDTGSGSDDRITFEPAQPLNLTIGGPGRLLVAYGPNYAVGGSNQSIAKPVTATEDGYGKAIRYHIEYTNPVNYDVEYAIYINNHPITNFTKTGWESQYVVNNTITIDQLFTNAIAAFWGINWGEKFLYGQNVGYFYRYGFNTSFVCHEKWDLVTVGSRQQKGKINGIYVG